jgi:hypothetical protein
MYNAEYRPGEDESINYKVQKRKRMESVNPCPKCGDECECGPNCGCGSECECCGIVSENKGENLMKFKAFYEGTWALPKSSADINKLKKLMSKPMTLGKDGKTASSAMYNIIGDDGLFDNLYTAGKSNPNGDARPIILKWIKANAKKYQDQTLAKAKL